MTRTRIFLWLLAWWLCVLSVRGADGVTGPIVHNTTGSTIYLRHFRNCGSGYIVLGGRIDIAAGGDQNMGIDYVWDTCTHKIIAYPTAGDADAQTSACFTLSDTTINVGYRGSTINSGGCSAAPSTYYASGCVTNHTDYAARFIMYIYAANGGTQDQFESPPLAPGEYWCKSYTNANPFQYEICRLTFNSDGGTNATLCSGKGWGQTNSPPSNPTGHDAKEDSPNNPMDNDPANGNTNLLDKATYNRGVSNIINSIYGAQQQNNAGFKLLYGATTNNPGGAGDGTNLVPWLSAISNNTASASNDLGKIEASQRYWSNLVAGILTNVALASNYSAHISNGLAASNIMAGVAASNLVSKAHDSTNVASMTANSSIWEVSIWTNCSLTMGSINVDPTRWNVVRGLVPWLRLVLMFFIVWMAWDRIYEKVTETSLGLYLVPGAGVGSGQFLIGTFFGAASPVVMATALAGFPVVLAAAIQGIATIYGGAVIGPLSETAISVMSGAFGDYTPHARAALYLLFYFCPVTFIFQVFIYMVAFEIAIFGLAHFASMLIKGMMN